MRRVFIEVRQTLAICLTFYPLASQASSRDSRAEPADKVYVYNSSASLSRWHCKYLRFSAVSSRVQRDVYRIFLHLHAIRCLTSVLVFFVFRALEPSKRKTRQLTFEVFAFLIYSQCCLAAATSAARFQIIKISRYLNGIFVLFSNYPSGTRRLSSVSYLISYKHFPRHAVMPSSRLH